MLWRWPVDRLVQHRVATLEEIRRAWTMDDVLNHNELLDVKEEQSIAEAEARMAEQKMREAEMQARTRGRRR